MLYVLYALKILYQYRWMIFKQLKEKNYNKAHKISPNYMMLTCDSFKQNLWENLKIKGWAVASATCYDGWQCQTPHIQCRKGCALA